MGITKLYFVYLRRPSSLCDRRDDPFWEFGSFGRTGCHCTNLMNPHRPKLHDGDRLAFLQGGHGEIRVISLTPPITLMPTAEGIEARWDKRFRPYQFSEAPLFIDNSGNSDFLGVREELNNINRSTWCGKAGSHFRSRTCPIDEGLEANIIKTFARWKGSTAKIYLDAVEASNGAWYSEGIAQGWATKRNRKSRYLSCGGIFPNICGPVTTHRLSHLEPEPSATCDRRKKS